MGTDDDSKALVRRLLEEGWNTGDAEAVRDLIDEHYASNDGVFRRGMDFLHGHAAFAEHLRQYRSRYDDLVFAVDRMVVDGATVITVWSASGLTRGLTFTDRGGEQQPYELHGQGVSLTDVVDGKVTRHDLFWPRDPLFP
jgi:hypothetical protein